MQHVQLIECPRDAMQGWKHIIPTGQKINYINALLQVGFHTLDFGSFVSPKAIPQMADSAQVMDAINHQSSQTKLLAIVANTRGATNAAQFNAIDYLGFPFSISPTFQLKNTNSTIEESLQRVDEIQDICVRTNKQLVIYLSMGFGNPYGDEYNQEILLKYADEMVCRGIKIISLADTVGLATPDQVTLALNTLIPKYPGVQVGVHLHSAVKDIEPKLQAAVEAGCFRFDGALKGIGGCPMAQDELVGNMPTEYMISFFEGKGMVPPINKEALNNCLSIASEIFE